MYCARVGVKCRLCSSWHPGVELKSVDFPSLRTFAVCRGDENLDYTNCDLPYPKSCVRLAQANPILEKFYAVLTVVPGAKKQWYTGTIDRTNREIDFAPCLEAEEEMLIYTCTRM